MHNSMMEAKVASYMPIFVDIETTGFEIDADLTEIGVYDPAECEEWGSLVKNDNHSADPVAHVSGITDKMLASAPRITDVMKEFMDRYVDEYSIFAAHNGDDFDYPRISRYMSIVKPHCKTIEELPTIDTFPIARRLIPFGDVTAYSIASLMRHFKIEGEQIHRASSDAFFNYLVYERLLDILRIDHPEIVTFKDLREFASINPRVEPRERSRRTVLKMIYEIEDELAFGETKNEDRLDQLIETYEKI